MFVNRLPVKITELAIITSPRTTSLTARAQMDTLVDSARQVGCEQISVFFFMNTSCFHIYIISNLKNARDHIFTIIFLFVHA